MTALAEAPAQNANTFVGHPANRRAARPVHAERPGAGGARAGLRRGTGVRHPAALPRWACRSVYGISFEQVVPLDAGGPVSLQALRNGDIDVALLFTSDPALAGGDLVELRR